MKGRFSIFRPWSETEAEVETEPLSESRFRALVRLAYAVVGVTGFLIALWLIGFPALIILFPVFIIVLLIVSDKL